MTIPASLLVTSLNSSGKEGSFRFLRNLTSSERTPVSLRGGSRPRLSILKPLTPSESVHRTLATVRITYNLCESLNV